MLKRYLNAINRRKLIRINLRHRTTRTAENRGGYLPLKPHHYFGYIMLSSIFVEYILNLFAHMEEFPLLTDKDQERLEDAITLSTAFRFKLNIFNSGLIPPEERWLQHAAHRAYDNLSERELQVFKLRCKMLTFPLIGEQLGISTSSAKTYWRRALMKCAILWESSNPLLVDDEEE
jgi:DNA-binding CsgD family transcriptional regulator